MSREHAKRATDTAPGRVTAQPERTRTETVRVSLRPSEYDDLATIAAGWDVRLATAAWAILSTELARARREAPDLGGYGVAIAAGLRVLARA